MRVKCDYDIVINNRSQVLFGKQYIVVVWWNKMDALSQFQSLAIVAISIRIAAQRRKPRTGFTR